MVWNIISDDKTKLESFLDKLVMIHRGVLQSHQVTHLYLYYPDAYWDEFIRYKAVLRPLDISIIECHDDSDSLDRIYRWAKADDSVVTVLSGNSEKIYDRYVYHRNNLVMWKVSMGNTFNYKIIGPNSRS